MRARGQGRHGRYRRPTSPQAQAVPRHSDREPAPVPGRRDAAIANPWSATRPGVAHLAPGATCPASSLVAPGPVTVFPVAKCRPCQAADPRTSDSWRIGGWGPALLVAYHGDTV